MPGVPVDIMNKIMGGSGDVLKKLTQNMEIIATELEEIRDNQNQIIPALASIYQALEVIAAKQNIKLPEPYIDMKYEKED
jgi:CII-binding regulator of phage lambda lysogenization HflD